MGKKVIIPVWVATVSLSLFALLVLLRQLPALADILFGVSPFLVGWMVYNVIRRDTYTGRELEEEEEYGYGDMH